MPDSMPDGSVSPTDSHDRRWKPARAGIRNIWEYDDQIFEFADGRLVLRGPNGSGKSNALALLLPFLLDGVMAASRMDSLGGGRSMKTLLLCLADDERSGGRFRRDQRTGYVWLELQRGGDHLTLGCGARASTSRDAEAWFFVTSKRVGVDLDLAPGGVPLTRGGLVDVLGPAAVFDSVEGYRTAVDRALFRVGTHRYRNLLELLVVLRRPHLAGRLNLELLSKVLSDGLIALDEDLLADVAASFEDLEAVQRDLWRLQEAHRSVTAFLPTYRRYIRAAARSRANAALDARRALRETQRRVTAAGVALTEAEQAVVEIQAAQNACVNRRDVADQRRRAVLESPAYRGAKDLSEVSERAREAADLAVGAASRLADADNDMEAAAGSLGQAQAAMASASTTVERTFVQAAEAADQAGVPWRVARGALEERGLEAAMREGAARRRLDISEVRGALSDAEKAQERADAASRSAAAATVRAEEAEHLRAHAAEGLENERAVLVDAVGEWAAACRVGGLERLVAAIPTLGEPGAPTLSGLLEALLRPMREELEGRRVRAQDRRQMLEEDREAVRADRRRVAEEPVPSPPRTYTRPAARVDRPGAPLFACCDFRPGASAADQAGLEAALEASGLLDAWIGEGGAQEGDDGWDAWLRSEPRSPGSTLADVLVPTPPEGSGLSKSDVGAALATVALADAGIAVRADGRYTFGSLTGCWGKEHAEFIGATAREQLRQRRLAELDARIAGLTHLLEEVRRLLDDVDAASRALERTETELPSPRGLLEARERLLTAAAAARTAATTAEDAEATAAGEARAAAEAIRRLQSKAAERRLPATAAGLSDVDALVVAYERYAHELARAVGTLAQRRSDHGAAHRQHETALVRLEARRRELEEAERNAAGLAARVGQLRTLLGADAEAPLRELEAVEATLRDLGVESSRLVEAFGRATDQRGAARKEQELATARLAEEEEDLARAEDRLEVLRRPDVWAEIVDDDSVPPVSLAKLAEVAVGATAGVAGEPDEGALGRAARTLLDELGRGYDPSLLPVDHLWVAEVTSEAGTFPVRWLARELEAHVARQQDLLTERDREIFERHLLTRVCEKLRDRLNDADEFVGRINSCLAVRPTASGKYVRLRWEPDSADPSVRAALGLLRKTPDLLGPDERERLRRFFATAIAQLRAEDGAKGYLEVLREVLDYRGWHSFVPHIVSAGGGSQRLTRTLFKSLSGGEQAVVLHLPLFAAAAAHYGAADPAAPRMVALDEAFAGIDEGMRGELMGLLVQFDLDVILTGHELWGAYEQVPSLMVYDLLRRPPLEGVSAYAARWDGLAMAEA